MSMSTRLWKLEKMEHAMMKRVEFLNTEADKSSVHKARLVRDEARIISEFLKLRE